MPDYDSYFQQFGLPSETVQEQQARRMTDNRAHVVSNAAVMRGFGGEAFGAGYLATSMLAQTLGDTWAKKKGRLLTDGERKKNAMQARARSIFEQRHTPDMTAEQGRLLFQEASTEAAYEAGLPEIGAEMAGKMSQERQALAKRDLEVRKLEQGVELNERELTRDRAHEEAREGASNIKPVWVRDPATGQYSTEPVEAYMSGEGARVGDTVFGTGEFTSINPATWAGANTPGEKRRALASFVTPSRIGKLQDKAKEFTRKVRANSGIVRLLGEAQKELATIDFMGGSGKALSGLTKLTDNINASLRGSGVGHVMTVVGGSRDESGYSTGGEATSLGGMIEKSPEVKQAFARLDPTGQFGARMQSKVMELAYAHARANEPGARQLSDADIANSLTIIGAGLTNPETMRRIFRDNVDMGRKSIQDDIAFIPQELQSAVYTREGGRRMNEALAEWDELTLDKDFGEAEAPGAGLREMETATDREQVLTFGDDRSQGIPRAAAPSESTVAEPPSSVPGLTDEEIAEQEAGIDADLEGLWMP